MARHRRRHSPDDISWPPRHDKVEVMDLESGKTHALDEFDKGPAVLDEDPAAPERPAVLPSRPAQRHDTKGTSPGFWPRLRSRLHLGGRGEPGRFGVDPLYAAVVVLAALAVAEGVFIFTRVLGRSAPPAVSGPASPGSIGTSGTSATGSNAGAATRSAGQLSEGPSDPQAAASGSAYLAVRTQPPGSTVYLDGQRLGVTPTTVPELAAGRHKVRVYGRTRSVEHEFEVTAGEVVSLIIPLGGETTTATPSASEGTLSVQAPVELRIFDGDRLLGTSAMERVPVPAGTRRLQFENDALGYQEERTVRVTAGKTTTLDVTMPEQRVAINALPWAEVWVDGRRVGETPIGELRLRLGPHVVVLRHPQLGERTIKTVIRANEPARIGVDMRK